MYTLCVITPNRTKTHSQAKTLPSCSAQHRSPPLVPTTHSLSPLSVYFVRYNSNTRRRRSKPHTIHSEIVSPLATTVEQKTKVHSTTRADAHIAPFPDVVASSSATVAAAPSPALVPAAQDSNGKWARGGRQRKVSITPWLHNTMAHSRFRLSTVKEGARGLSARLRRYYKQLSEIRVYRKNISIVLLNDFQFWLSPIDLHSFVLKMSSTRDLASRTVTYSVQDDRLVEWKWT